MARNAEPQGRWRVIVESKTGKTQNSKTQESKTIDIPKFVRAEILCGDDIVMYSTVTPELNPEKQRIEFPRIAVLGCLKSDYLSEDFSITIYEEGNDKASIELFVAGITAFGHIELKEKNNATFVLLDDVVFEYDWGYDIQERFIDSDVESL